MGLGGKHWRRTWPVPALCRFPRRSPSCRRPPAGWPSATRKDSYMGTFTLATSSFRPVTGPASHKRSSWILELLNPFQPDLRRPPLRDTWLPNSRHLQHDTLRLPGGARVGSPFGGRVGTERNHRAGDVGGVRSLPPPRPGPVASDTRARHSPDTGPRRRLRPGPRRLVGRFTRRAPDDGEHKIAAARVAFREAAFPWLEPAEGDSPSAAPGLPPAPRRRPAWAYRLGAGSTRA